MVFLLPLIYLLCHGLALIAFHAHAPPISFAFLVGAPLLAALACVRQAAGSEVRESWLALALSMLLWAGGMALNMYQEVFLANVDSTPGASMLLYILYGVPLTFMLGSAQRDVWYVRLIDAVLAASLGYLFFVHTFAHATLSDATEQGAANLRLMFDIENLFIAGSAIARYIASANSSGRDVLRSLTIFALIYLATAVYINHLQPENTDFGGLSDLLIDVPFLTLAVIAGRRWASAPHAPLPARLVHSVRAASPLMLPVSLMVVAALITPSHPRLAIAGFVLATLGYGLRSVLTQVRSFEDQEQLGRLARIDPLTGLFNRRHFEEALHDEWHRARRTQQGLALLLIDIDHFKRLNDSFGHQVGDACLRAVAQALAQGITGAADVVARFGGEEFAVILPALTPAQASDRAELMRLAVERLVLAADCRLTVSVGVGYVMRISTDDSPRLIEITDAALYDAKHGGRNRVAQRILRGSENRAG